MNTTMKDLHPNTKSDHVLNKVIYLNGKKLGGVQRLNVDLSLLRDNDIRTLVDLTLAIKKNSLKIVEKGRGKRKVQHVYFETL